MSNLGIKLRKYGTIGITGFLFSLSSTYAAKAAQVNLESKSSSSTTGKLELLQRGNEVLIQGEISGLEPNSVHGFHVHENGDCSSKDAKSAGGHFNPMKVKHGGPQMNHHHAGDLGNIRADKNGIAKIDKKYSFLTIQETKKSSILNKAIVVHSKADDLESQPSGDAGKRIACGVITKTSL